ncbi:hypothetical protein PAXRUDRAFT_38013, partial [Paxillus rubicundulus Ve08.2h10]
SRLYDVLSLKNNGSNFQYWKHRVLTVLNLRGLMGLINGTESKPDPSNPLVLENWVIRDKEAQAQITLTLKDKPLSGVLYVNTAQEAWKKLKEQYEGK